MLCKDSNKTFTFFYNLILYLLLIKKVPKSVLYTYLLFSVPILVIGEYIMWITKYYKKCNFNLQQGIIISFISHWVPFILFMKMKKTEIDKDTILKFGFMFLVYVLYFGEQIKNIYKL